MHWYHYTCDTSATSISVIPLFHWYLSYLYTSDIYTSDTIIPVIPLYQWYLSYPNDTSATVIPLYNYTSDTYYIYQWYIPLPVMPLYQWYTSIPVIPHLYLYFRKYTCDTLYLASIPVPLLSLISISVIPLLLY